MLRGWYSGKVSVHGWYSEETIPAAAQIHIELISMGMRLGASLYESKVMICIQEL